jgi:hypothetical protein
MCHGLAPVVDGIRGALCAELADKDAVLFSAFQGQKPGQLLIDDQTVF